MEDVDWVNIAIEAPLSALLLVILYKCYRARVEGHLDSECHRCANLCPSLRLHIDFNAPGVQVEEGTHHAVVPMSSASSIPTSEGAES